MKTVTVRHTWQRNIIMANSFLDLRFKAECERFGWFGYRSNVACEVEMKWLFHVKIRESSKISRAISQGSVCCIKILCRQGTSWGIVIWCLTSFYEEWESLIDLRLTVMDSSVFCQNFERGWWWLVSVRHFVGCSQFGRDRPEDMTKVKEWCWKLCNIHVLWRNKCCYRHGCMDCQEKDRDNISMLLMLCNSQLDRRTKNSVSKFTLVIN